MDARKSLLKYLAVIDKDLKLMNGESLLYKYGSEVTMLMEAYEHVFLPSTQRLEKLTQEQINVLIKTLSHACQIEKDAIELIKSELQYLNVAVQ